MPKKSSGFPPDPCVWRPGRKWRGKRGRWPAIVRCGVFRRDRWGPSAATETGVAALEVAIEYDSLRRCPRYYWLEATKSKHNLRRRRRSRRRDACDCAALKPRRGGCPHPPSRAKLGCSSKALLQSLLCQSAGGCQFQKNGCAGAHPLSEVERGITAPHRSLSNSYQKSPPPPRRP